MLKEDFGIMDEGYFSSRSEIIPWINNLLQVKHTIFTMTAMVLSF